MSRRLEAYDAAEIARLRAFVEHDPELLGALRDVWWIAFRAGVGAGVDVRDHPNRGLQQPENPFRPVPATAERLEDPA
jgi:hypothetical protein